MGSSHANCQRRTTRKAFLLNLAAATSAAVAPAQQRSGSPKVLLVVAHPDDEYTFAATVFAITQELGGPVDQVVITNGEAGFRYSAPAERFYGLRLTREDVGRRKLPAIRREETLRAGRILGIRRHYFLNQKDARFTLDGQEGLSGIWDTQAVEDRIGQLLKKESYDFVLMLLPTKETHGHHQAASLLALKSIAKLPPAARPVALGSEPSSGESRIHFGGRSDFPLMRVEKDARVFQFPRTRTLGPNPAMDYNIVVNWVIAEHKSQGLFQTEYGKHSRENFWVFDTGAPEAVRRTGQLFAQLGCL